MVAFPAGHPHTPTRNILEPLGRTGLPYIYLDRESCLAPAAKGTKHDVKQCVCEVPAPVESHTSASSPYPGGGGEHGRKAWHGPPGIKAWLTANQLCELRQVA